MFNLFFFSLLGGGKLRRRTGCPIAAVANLVISRWLLALNRASTSFGHPGEGLAAPLPDSQPIEAFWSWHKSHCASLGRGGPES